MVEDVVNRVGVDVNTASASLLGYVSGITPSVAKNIVAFREENGAFTDRRQLKKVPKLGPKAYLNAAGFLRISGGKNPLDATSVHPESYEVATAVLERAGVAANELSRGGVPDIERRLAAYRHWQATLTAALSRSSTSSTSSRSPVATRATTHPR